MAAEPWWHRTGPAGRGKTQRTFRRRAVEHACFLVSAGSFWWAVLKFGRHDFPWALLALLSTLMHTGFLGAVLRFARAPLHGEARDIQDQQLAGLIMWVLEAIPWTSRIRALRSPGGALLRP